MAGVNLPLNIYGAMAWDLVETLPDILNSDLAKDIVQPFYNNPFHCPHDLETLTVYPASTWMDLIDQGLICISPPPEDIGDIGQPSKPSPAHSHDEGTSVMRTYKQEPLLPKPKLRGERESVGRYSYRERPQDGQIETIPTAHPRDGVYSNYTYSSSRGMSTTSKHENPDR